jgi:hypothetical protein
METRAAHGASVALTNLRRPPRRVYATVLGYAAAAAALGSVALALARGHAIIALMLACLLTICVTAVVRPRAYRLVAWLGIAALPFATAWAALKPDEYNYPLYLGAFTLLIIGLGALQTGLLPRTAGTLYLGYILVAGCVSVVTAFGAGGIGRLGYVVTAFGAYVLVHRAGVRERRFLVTALLAMCAIQAILSVLQSLVGWPIFPTQLEVLMRSDRNYFAYLVSGASIQVVQGSGTFYHFNALGGVLALAVPIAFGLWLDCLRSPWRLGLFATVLAGTVTTYSRGALLGALAGVLFVVIFERSRSRRVMTLLVLCVIVIASLLALSTASQYYETTQNVGIRAETWRMAAVDALNQPSNLLFGYGYDHFHSEVLSTNSSGTGRAVRSTVMSSLHSGPLQLALEFGVVGVILFALWIIAAFRAGLGSGRSRLTVALLGGAVAFLCHQAIDTSLFLFPGVLFAVVIGLAEAEAKATASALVDTRDDAHRDRR